jgi:hypothetical protein
MSTELDRELLGKLLGMLGSAHDGEALSAARKADELIRNAGLSWFEVLEPFDQLRIAVDAARQLLRENETLRAEIPGGPAPARPEDWQTAGNPSEQAKWCLNLADAGEVFLNFGEEQFLISLEKSGDPLTKTQRWFFERLLREVGERTGKVPP